MAYIDRLCEKLKVPSGETFMRLCVAASCLYVYGQEEFVGKGYMEGQKCMRVYDRLAGGYNTFEWDVAVRMINGGATMFGEFFMSRVEASGDYWKDYVLPYCREYDVAAEYMDSQFFRGFIETLPFKTSEADKDVLAACLYVAIRDNNLQKGYRGELNPEEVIPECKRILMLSRDPKLFRIAEMANEWATEVCEMMAEETGHEEYNDLYTKYVFPYLQKNEILPGVLMAPTD